MSLLGNVGRAMAAVLVLSAAACDVGPDYVRPSAPVPANYKEMAGWQPARPSDAIDRGAWWSVFNDPVLDGLERQIDVGNQNLRATEAAYREARALVAEARAGLYPTLSGSSNIQRQRTAGASGAGLTTSSGSLGGQVSWEIDLWGKVRRQVESNVAAAQGSAADLASVRLSAQAELATDYFELRLQDSLQRLYDETVAAYERTLRIIRNQYAAGVAAQLDVVTAQTQVETTRATAVAIALQRAKYEHAIALLIGKPPAELSIDRGTLAQQVPGAPASLPSTLLERRPDIAQAERQMQAQNALIGVQIAAFYPTLDLTMTLSTVGSPFSPLATVWSLAAAGGQVIFDGGARTAATAAAHASYDQSVASYRQTVLAAFQDVEDELASVAVLGRQHQAQLVAEQLARRAADIALNEYLAGTQNYTAVVTAQATAFTAQAATLQTQAGRLEAAVSLIRALGGGWDNTQLPDMTELRNHPLRNPDKDVARTPPAG